MPHVMNIIIYVYIMYIHVFFYPKYAVMELDIIWSAVRVNGHIWNDFEFSTNHQCLIWFKDIVLSNILGHFCSAGVGSENRLTGVLVLVWPSFSTGFIGQILERSCSSVSSILIGEYGGFSGVGCLAWNYNDWKSRQLVLQVRRHWWVLGPVSI